MADATNIVAFRRRESPHLQGPAQCIACGHQWEGVAPIGACSLKCPSCGLMKGMFRYPITADEGDSLFICNCGCEAMVAYFRKGQFRIQCMNCGTHQTEAIFG